MTLWAACSSEPNVPAPDGARVEDPRPASGGVFKEGQGNDLPGRFQPRADDELEALLALGYVSGSEPIPDATGVLVHDPDTAYAAPSLYVSGQGPEAHLIDMDGTVLHRWRRSWFDIYPDAEVAESEEFPDHWRRAALLADGDLVVIWGGRGMARIGRDSTVRWALNEPIHHDVEVLADGTMWTLSRRRGRHEGLGKRPAVMDELVHVSADGQVLARHSLLDCFTESTFAPMVQRFPKGGDILHTNTLTVLDGAGAHGFTPFSAGNMLVSFRRIDTVAALHLEGERCEVVWALSGQWHAQHQPVLLPDGHMLMFDNRGLPGDHSRALEIDPLTQEISWSWGGTEPQPLYSKILGSVQRLPNGNTLITESDAGRVIEVDRAGDLAWLWVVPHVAGDGEFVASVYELVRLSPDLDLSWASPR